MAEHLITFPSPRHLEQLFRGRIDLLDEAENHLGVSLVAREAELRIKGSPEAIQQAVDFFDILRFAREQGLRIGPHDFQSILQGVKQNKTGELRELFSSPTLIQVQRKNVVPKTLGQKAYVDLIQKSSLTFGIGPAGTGKTYLAMACAVSALLKGEVERIILTRPAVEAGEALGFLPGDLKEKILPYLRPLYDAINDMIASEDVPRLMERGVIEIAPLAYMRGRTLAKAFIILDEAQNTTTEQMMMFLTRLGEDSKIVVTGDITQIDLPRSRQSGLVEAHKALHQVPGIAFSFLQDSDVVRHPLVQRIIRAYRHYRGEQTEPSHPFNP